MSLTPLQSLFVDEYLKCWNATEAAKKAGYSEKSAYSIGQENLKKPEVWGIIAARLDESAMSANEVLMRLGEQARVNIGDFFVIEPGETEGLTLRLDYQKIKEKGHLVKSLTWTQYGPKLELHDAQAALRDIGKHHKLFTDNIKVEADASLQKWLSDLAQAGKGESDNG